MKRVRLIVAPLLAGALIAAGCGSDDGDSGSEDTQPVATDAAPETGDGDGTDGEGGDAGTEAEAEGDGETGDSATGDMTPQRGGTLVSLLEAESDTWDIPSANCAVSCITVMRQVADPLLIRTADGQVEPHLLESFSVNDDFTEWTFVMRDGVMFHDGTMADGAAVQRNLIEMASGLLQGQVFLDLANGTDSIVLADEKTVVVSFARPVASFGEALAERTGWLFAPSFWDDPERAGALPIATGPFRMDEWIRGEETRLVAWENYWRTDANGEQLPYLDGINFRPVPDVSTRRATMEAGDADSNMDSFGENREFWNGEWLDQGNSLAPRGSDRETGYLMFNNAEGSPFADPDLRRAVALCTDRDEYIAFRSPGNSVANGPFAEGAAGYLEDPGFPQFDAEAGNALLDEIGRPEVINYGTTNVPSNLLTAELFADMWSTNCGLNVNIDQFDQSELITKAITGDFEVFLWRNHGQGNPALELIWWHSRHAVGLALNFGRIVDPEMDELLFAANATIDPAELDAIGQDINRQFAANVYNLWLETSEWANPYRAGVNGVNVMTLASGNEVTGSLAGRVYYQEAWIEQG